MLLRDWLTTSPWQLVVPQLTCATRRSPGFTKRTKSADSRLSSVYERVGLAELRHAVGYRLAGAAGQPPGPPAGRAGADPGVGFTMPLFPPWQSVHPRRSDTLQCGSLASMWQERQLSLLRATDSSDCLLRSTPSSSGGMGKGMLGSRSSGVTSSAMISLGSRRGEEPS